jgi:hypothetical protein
MKLYKIEVSNWKTFFGTLIVGWKATIKTTKDKYPKS